MPLSIRITSVTATRNTWIKSVDIILMIGRILILNTTFFTRKEYARSAPVPEPHASEKKNQGTIPTISQQTKG